MENNNDLFEFIGDDIYSSSASAEENFEDIVSDSKLKGKHFAKKKRGNFFTKWWRRRQKWQKAVMISATSLVLVLAITVGVLLKVFDYNYNNITGNPDDLGFASVIDKKVTNVALFGIDSRQVDSFKGLSDSIMILSLNAETKKVKVISVMRDSLVPITYNGKTTYGKINSAYSKGGPELAIKTLNTIFGLDISEYATVNFYGMADIIDAVGGIDVELAEGELDVYGKDVLIQSLVHALKHRVIFSVFILHREILFNAENTFQSHILSDFYSIGTPWSNHFTARSHKATLQIFFFFNGGFAIKPA